MRTTHLFLSTLATLLLSITSTNAQSITWYQDSDGDGWGNPSVTTSSASKPGGYVQNNFDCNDAVANASAWSVVGTAGISPYTATYTAIAVDATGIPYVGYNDNGNGATVYKYAGSSWSMVGSQYFTGQPQYASMFIDGSDNLYFAAQNNNSGQAPTMMKFASGSWSQLGGSLPTSNGSIYNSSAIDASGNVYYAYQELYFPYSNKLTVMKYNGSAWSVVGTQGFSTGSAEYTSVAVNASGTPYVAFRDGANSNKVTVMMYNGASWVNVGSAGLSAGPATYISLAIDQSGAPHVAYNDGSNSNKLTVMKYSGGSWAAVGSAGFSAGSADYIALRIDYAGVPYVAYTDGGNSNKATVVKYSGGSWAAVLSAGFTSGTANHLSFTLYKGIPYLAFQDGANSNRATVMKLGMVEVPASTPVVTASPIFSCFSGPVTLTVLSGSLNDATAWKWYSGSCGGTPIGTGATLTTTVSATTTFYARGENICPTSNGSCGFASTTIKNSPLWYQDSDGDGWGNPAVVMANCGQPTGYVANNMDCSDVSVTSTQWYTLGSSAASSAQALYTSIAIDANGNPYVGYYDNYVRGTVMKFSSGNWNTFGSSNFTASSTQHNSLAFDATGTTLYMTYQDAFNGASVMKNTGSGWANVGSSNFTLGQASYESIAVAPSGMPYVAYVDAYWMYSNKASVMRYNGSAWEVVGSYGFSPGTVNYTSLAIDGGGTPYVAFADGNSANKITVMKYNGSSWVVLGAAGFSAGTATYCKIALDQYGFPYVVYNDGGNGNKATVMKFNGTTWVTVGSAGFSAGTANYTSIAMDAGGYPYVVYSDGANSNKATVMKFNGSSWAVYGSAGISGSAASYTTIAIDAAGLPVIAFQHENGTNSATVMKAGPVATTATTPTAGATFTTISCGGSTTLTATGSLNGAGAWYWYSGSCGGTYVGTGGSVTVTPTGTTTYYVRGENGCLTTPGNCGNITINVNAATPSVPAISGVSPECVGSTRTLTNTLTGGTWTSSNTSVATAGSATGIISGVGVGNTTISYTWGGACGTGTVTSAMTVNASPGYNPITGTTTVAVGNTTTLSNATGGGTWTSANNYLATVGSSTGIVTPYAPGTVTISYTISNSCGTNSTTTMVSINPSPTVAAIGGSGNVCQGATITLTNASGGGGWSSSNLAVATINAGGVVTGISGGTTIITYTVSSNFVTKTVTVGPLADPGTITGTASACVGATTTLANATGGGVWSSGGTSIATVGTGGVVTGVAGGTVTISYGVTNSCGTTYATRMVTINPLANPGTITGTATVCTSATTTLGNATGGGVWSTGNGSVASVGTSGIVTGNAIGTTTISYGVTNSCGTQYATRVVTVNTLADPGTITGTASVCVGATTPLSNATGGGVWSSGSPSLATVGTGGVVTGVAAGNPIISYAVTNGCGTSYATKTATVNPLAVPGTVTGTATVCISATTTFSNATGGGVWSSGNTSVATVGTGGVVTGAGTGTAIISYGVTNGCGTQYATRTVTVSTVAPAGTITGTASMCVSTSATLSNGTGGGVWSTSNASIATVGTNGSVGGVAAGTATISYGVTNSCGTSYATRVATVNPLADPGTITGTASVCVNATTALGNAVNGGVWSSSNTSVATVGTSGIVTGVAAGNATISYAVTNGCGTQYSTIAATVNPLADPGTITGTSSVCVAATTALINAVNGGVWSSSNTSVATVGTSGIVTGVAAGNATISYAVTNGCGTQYATRIVTVNPLADPGTITGTASVCENATTALSNAVNGGIWSSSNTSVATVGTGGIVTGVAAGNATISYAVTNGCGTQYATRIVTVNPLADPGTITGTASVCENATTALGNAVNGGIWSSSNTSVATVGTGGIVTGVAAGNATISYAVTNGWGTQYATIEATVNPLADAGTITGTASVCVDATTALGNAVNGGVWSSSNTSVATVGTGGIVTGVAAGNATISYAVTNGCGTQYATIAATVNPLADPGTITGTSSVCVAATTALSNAVNGGVWSSSNTSVATVGTSGIVTGVAAGNATISYAVTNGCGTQYATIAATVNPLADVGTITGTSSVCVAATTALGNAVNGGVWSSSNISVATVGTSGIVTGVAAGNATISYAVTNGCGTQYATRIVTVNPLADPGTITGTASVCENATTALSNAVNGGAWSSSNTSVATVGTNGIVTGVAAGNATISYAVTNGCGTQYATIAATVNPLADPGTITGTSSVCVAATTALSNAVNGGVWSSSNISVAAVGTDGVVSGESIGDVVISYHVTTGCGTAFTTYAMTVITVPTVNVITGTTVICALSTTDLDDATPGGAWSSDNTSIATVGTSGLVTGASAGIVMISYTNANICGSVYATQSVTVNASSGTITGASTVCLGGTTTFSIADADGTWSSSNGAVATVNGSTGVVTSVSLGATRITYTAGTGCFYTTKTITVNNPVAVITGAAALCAASTATLSSTTPDGAWSSYNTGVCTIDANSGVVTGVAAGTATIRYTTTGGCYTTSVLNVYAMPAPIAGASTMCTGRVLSLTTASGGSGRWYSSDTNVAAISNILGTVNGNTTGSVTITYKIPYSGCYVTKELTVNETPAAISGLTPVCVGRTYTLTSATSGGTWASYRPAVATIDATTGSLTAIAGGGTTITYTTPEGCYRTYPTTVNANPHNITAASFNMCVGSGVSLSSPTGGGTWTSSNTSVATVGSSTGVATGMGVGTTVVSYTAANGCYATATLSAFSTLPSITGNSVVCAGYNTPLSNPMTGGTWSSGNTYIVTINSITGMATGLTNGTATISYKLGGCATTMTMSVAAIVGDVNVCVGSTTTLDHAVAGGTWSCSNTARATVDAHTGVVTGVTAGTATITYTVTTGIYNTRTIIVKSIPPAITGVDYICTGSATTLYSATDGSGFWSSSDPSVAPVNPVSGILSGATAGTATITYTISYSGCYVTKQFTVAPTPAGISGTTGTCAGSTSTFTNAMPGGSWTSSNTSVASIDASSGLLTGITGGGTTVTYTMPYGCISTYATTVNVLPHSITGTSFSVCPGATATLSSLTSGGIWSSENSTVATIGSATGIVSGLTLGTSRISYTGTNGCSTTSIMTVHTTIPAIGGSDIVCKGYNTTLSNSSTGGTWSSSNTTIATINSITGILRGVNGGTATISYRLGGCAMYKTMTVAAITGNINVCVGTNTEFTHLVQDGTWSISNTARATIDAGTGIVTGVSPGTAIVTYAVSGLIYNTVTIIVNALPAAITGPSSICTEGYATYVGTAGGNARWWSSDTTVATAQYVLGTVTGISAGTVTLTYKIPATGCYTTRDITVLQRAEAIIGSATVCAGSTTSLTSATDGGVWSSSNTVASIGSASGLVTGNTGGGFTVTYTPSNGCYRTRAMTVNGAPAAISGPGTVNQGGTVTLGHPTGGGAWSSSHTSIALPVTPMSGVVSGINAGSTTITYTLANGCHSTKNLYVVAAKPGEPITANTENTAVFRLYPNPTSGIFTIESPVNGRLTIYTLDGKKVSEFAISDSKVSISLPADLSAGVYMCQFRFEDGTTKTERLFYQH